MLNRISLNEFIAQVKKDLSATEDSPIFFLDKAELEIHVSVSHEDSFEGQIQGKSALKISVLGIDFLNLGELQASGKASDSLERQDIHTIKVTLVPIFTKEEMKTTLNPEEMRKIKAGIKSRIMRGTQEENNSNLSKEELEKTTTKKIMRG
ncbi:hypothetical protein BCD64_23730 [Nostoc sp. MBR 210]|nr:hypothetical protein BCD64_23730 [Nostoc sp. MBR 210]